jgi:lactate permease
MMIAAGAVALVALSTWGMVPLAVGAASFQGAHRSLTIIWILIGAITLLYTAQNTGAVERIRNGFIKISPDQRIQLIIVGFAFLSLIEGSSGFGTPAVVVAPLLIALGFRPIVAASVALISDTVACTFGAVGTPLVVGLENVSSYSPHLVGEVARLITLFDLVIGTLLPLGLVIVLVVWFGSGTRRERWGRAIEIAPWALFVGAIYSVTAFAAVRVLGVEFAAIIAALVTLIVSIASAKYRFLLPQQNRLSYATENVTLRQSDGPDCESRRLAMSLLQAWAPYILIVVLLLATRTVAPIKSFLLTHFDASWHTILGYAGVDSAWPVLYSPGTILLVAAFVAAGLQTRSIKPALGGLKKALRTAAVAALALVPTLVMVQIFTNSGLNTSGLPAMPLYIGEVLAGVTGEHWLYVSPALGMVGAFIAGSATVSNLTMSVVQEGAAASAGLSLALVLAMQVLGAVSGNIIAIHNVVAAAAVVGLTHKEGVIIRRVLPAALLYMGVVVCLGFVYHVVISH